MKTKFLIYIFLFIFISCNSQITEFKDLEGTKWVGAEGQGSGTVWTFKNDSVIVIQKNIPKSTKKLYYKKEGDLYFLYNPKNPKEQIEITLEDMGEMKWIQFGRFQVGLVPVFNSNTNLDIPTIEKAFIGSTWCVELEQLKYKIYCGARPVNNEPFVPNNSLVIYDAGMIQEFAIWDVRKIEQTIFFRHIISNDYNMTFFIEKADEEFYYTRIYINGVRHNQKFPISISTNNYSKIKNDLSSKIWSIIEFDSVYTEEAMMIPIGEQSTEEVLLTFADLSSNKLNFKFSKSGEIEILKENQSIFLKDKWELSKDGKLIFIGEFPWEYVFEIETIDSSSLIIQGLFNMGGSNDSEIPQYFLKLKLK